MYNKLKAFHCCDANRQAIQHPPTDGRGVLRMGMNMVGGIEAEDRFSAVRGVDTYIKTARG